MLGETNPLDKKVAIRRFYKETFNDSPKLHSTILHRAVIANKVIGHKSINGKKKQKNR